MNFLNLKYNKMFPVSLIVCGTIALLGIVMQIVLGFSSSIVEPISLSGLILNLAIVEVVVNVLEFIYLAIRFDFSTALSLVLKNILDVLLICGVFAITRLNVTQSFVGAVVVGIIINSVCSMMILETEKNLTSTESDWNEVVDKSVFNNSKIVVLLNAVVILLLVCLTAPQILVSSLFVIASIISIVVTFSTTMFVLAPVWAFFRKREVKLVRNKKVKPVAEQQETNEEPVAETETVSEEQVEIK